MDYEILANCTGFEWDTGNLSKNWDKHLVSRWECEQVFFNRPILIHDDQKHSIKERRIYLLGKTNMQRKLFIVFTIRNKLIRIISARDMNRKEQNSYEQLEKSTTI
ncbi:MAG: hypothetical protein A3C55_06000 [Gammaproteobacteria bacterium RIFCSPHIGHO2_02_FULL_42_13]|nr:MAG: hypothetical protein A3C55_06000 [Gammaproteobacteria bacterium RIFCSPHIGHO2_02_FULL_42_13]OGT70736.1 MAG: hypothetical protein A3H43_04985 [Gammaproteobacteria bacterium RIFCSPLOWO2_02_FULL_42_9]